MHESSVEFARLLLSEDIQNTHAYELWKDVFPLLYHGSVEQVAQRNDDMEMLLGFRV